MAQLGVAPADVGARLAHLVGDEPGPHEQCEDPATEAQAEDGLEEGCAGQEPDHGPGSGAGAEPEPQDEGGRRERHPHGLGEALGGSGHEPGGDGQAGDDHPGDELAQGAEARTGEDPGPEPVGEGNEQPRLAQGDGQDAHDHHAPRHQTCRHLVHRVGETHHRPDPRPHVDHLVGGPARGHTQKLTSQVNFRIRGSVVAVDRAQSGPGEVGQAPGQAGGLGLVGVALDRATCGQEVTAGAFRHAHHGVGEQAAVVLVELNVKGLGNLM